MFMHSAQGYPIDRLAALCQNHTNTVQGAKTVADLSNPILIDVPDPLETERLLLRSCRAGDGPVINKAIQESLEALERWMPWAVGGQTLEESEIFARDSAAQFIQRTTLNYLLWTKTDPVFVGVCGIFDFEWTIPRCEIGYWLRTEMEGEGYMTETVNALTEMAFQKLDMNRVQIRCQANNWRSASVAERAGYTLEGRLRHRVRDTKGNLTDELVYAKVPVE